MSLPSCARMNFASSSCTVACKSRSSISVMMIVLSKIRLNSGGASFIIPPALLNQRESHLTDFARARFEFQPHIDIAALPDKPDAGEGFPVALQQVAYF